MANPLISQGSLNRLAATVTVSAFPALNVTPAFLGPEMVRLSLEGDTTAFYNTATGAVTSPNPYMPAVVAIHLLRSQGLALLYKQQMEADARIGDLLVRSDASAFGLYSISNTAIQSVEPQSYNGEDPSFRVTLRGYYNINANLWNAV